MKKKQSKGTWKLVVAILIFIFSLLYIGDDFKTFLIFVVIALCFGLWWAKSAGKLSAAKPAAQNVPQKVEQQTPVQPAAPKQHEIKKMWRYPMRIGDATLKYSYDLEYVSAPGINIRDDVMRGEERFVDVKSDNARIILLYDGKEIGYVNDSSRARILSDWEKNGDPVTAILKADCVSVYLIFYRDIKKYAGSNEQTVVELTSYKSEEQQILLSGLKQGDEVYLGQDEDFDDAENAVLAAYNGEIVGKLPSKAANRYLEEGAYGALIESVDFDESESYKPTIRIFWNK